ncbi:MAG: hypothetical protein ACOYNZ_19815 [Rhodoferax sp.]
MKKLIRIGPALIVAQLAGAAFAQAVTPAEPVQDKKLSLQLSPYAYHFTYDSEHKDTIMVGLEREHADARLDGVVLFTNSFGQPSIYVYPWGGVFHDLVGVKGLSFKWTAGVMYGYVDPYQDKVPYNYKGFSPVILPALAYQFTPGWSVQLDLLGTAGMMLQLNVRLH